MDNRTIESCLRKVDFNAYSRYISYVKMVLDQRQKIFYLNEPRFLDLS